jgi:hypothetical protein
VKSKPVLPSLSLEASEALRQLDAIMGLVEAGSLKATATERAHLSGAIESLRELSKIPQTTSLQ